MATMNKKKSARHSIGLDDHTVEFMDSTECADHQRNHLYATGPAINWFCELFAARLIEVIRA